MSEKMRDASLTAQEIERYARHIILPEIGGAGQQALKKARVLVLGAGGLGAPVLSYLAAAGVGTIGIVDDDDVSLSNLQRQIIHGTGDLARPKVDSAKDAIARINPHVQVEKHPLRLDADNGEAILSAYDIVADGTDNFTTRYLAADLCEALKKPLVTAALGRFDGSLTVVAPHLKDAKGRPAPRYRDLFPAPPEDGVVPSCAEAGVLGVMAGVMGCLQATEIIKLITGAGQPLIGKVLLYDALAPRFETIGYKRKGD